MGMVKFKTVFLAQVIVIAVICLQACGLKNTESTGTACSTGTAIIQIMDGSMKRVCGCTEASNQIFTSGLNLTCTVSAGTQLYIQFVSIATTHQISLPPYGTTLVRNPTSTGAVQTDVFNLNNTGTFNFTDVYSTSFTGTIVVN